MRNAPLLETEQGDAQRSSGSRTKGSCGFLGASEFLPGSAASADLASPAAFSPGGGSSGPLTPRPEKGSPAAPSKANATHGAIRQDLVPHACARLCAAMQDMPQMPVGPRCDGLAVSF